MLKIKTGTSTNSQASMAGKEAAAQVKENLQDMKMAFVYSGVQYDQKELLDAVSEELPGVPLIGNTSFTGSNYSGRLCQQQRRVRRRHGSVGS